MRDEQNQQQGGAGVPTTEEFYRILDLVRSVGRAYAGMYLERRESRKISKRQADEHFSEALVLAAQSREELTLLLKVLTWAAEEEARGKEAKNVEPLGRGADAVCGRPADRRCGVRFLKAAVLGVGRMAVLLAFAPLIVLLVVLDAGGMPGPLARFCEAVLWPVFGLARPWEEQNSHEA